MQFSLLPRAVSEYDQLPLKLQILVDKQLHLLIKDLHYPSLRAKKYDASQNIWQARVTHDYRFYFKIDGDTYKILTIIKHPK